MGKAIRKLSSTGTRVSSPASSPRLKVNATPSKRGRGRPPKKAKKSNQNTASSSLPEPQSKGPQEVPISSKKAPELPTPEQSSIENTKKPGTIKKHGYSFGSKVLAVTTAAGASCSKLIWGDDSAWNIPVSKRRKKRRKSYSTQISRKRRRNSAPKIGTTQAKTLDENAKYKLIVPNSKSYQYEIWRRLNQSDPMFSPMHSPKNCFEDKSSSSFYVLYRWLRVRMLSGMIRSSLTLVQNMLAKDYEAAKGILVAAIKDDSNSQVPRLLKIRQRISCLWCVYAHVILELGKDILSQKENFVLSEQTQQSSSPTPKQNGIRNHSGSGKSAMKKPYGRSTLSILPRKLDNGVSCRESTPEPKRRRGRPPKKKTPQIHSVPAKSPIPVIDDEGWRKMRDCTDNVTLADVRNHALSILAVARACPLVGNSTLVVLSFSRLIVSSFALENDRGNADIDLIANDLYKSVRSGIAACWDSMDYCHGTLKSTPRFEFTASPNMSIALIANFENCHRPVQKEQRVSSEEIGSSMNSTLFLPTRLKEVLEPSNVLFCDRDATRSLCFELNRLSKLGERIENDPSTRIRAIAGDGLLDHLTMFAAYDPVDKVQDPRTVCEDINFVGKNYRQPNMMMVKRTIQWEWQR